MSLALEILPYAFTKFCILSWFHQVVGSNFLQSDHYICETTSMHFSCVFPCNNSIYLFECEYVITNNTERSTHPRIQYSYGFQSSNIDTQKVINLQNNISEQILLCKTDGKTVTTFCTQFSSHCAGEMYMTDVSRVSEIDPNYFLPSFWFDTKTVASAIKQRQSRSNFHKITTVTWH